MSPLRTRLREDAKNRLPPLQLAGKQAQTNSDRVAPAPAVSRTVASMPVG